MTIRDAIYGDIDIKEPVIKALISTYEFQRLRNIKQLGLTYFIFPTAEHTRYTHCIGVYHLSNQICDVLEKKANNKFNEGEKLAFYIASLLHDIGHGPFSHTAEEVFNLDHEEYSMLIIEDENTQINQVLKQYCPELIDDIIKFITKKHTNKVLVSAMGSTIDIDRMDYLMRDSYFAGVVYGNFDFQRLLNVIDIKNNQIVFHEKGIRTVEDFILARYQMFEQVYLNQKTIALEAVAKEILIHCRKLYQKNYEFKTDISKLIPLLKGHPTVQEYIQVQDYNLLIIFNDFMLFEDDKILQKLAEFFILQKDFTEQSTTTYEIKTEDYDKILYYEPVLILKENGEVKKLEDVSKLINFMKNEMKILVKNKSYFVDLNE